MNRFIDLHTHSTCSDGTLTPDKLVKKAAEIGLAAVALTDHDTIAGLPEAMAAGQKYGIEVITGIEFSVTSDTELHMLGLNFSLDCPAINAVIDKVMVENRIIRNREVLKRLSEIGIDITEEEVNCEATSPIIGRSQIARVMLRKGYVSSVREAFDRYLAFGKPAFVPRKSLTPEKAISVIHESGGKAFLAHLNQTNKTDEELDTLLTELKAMGLDGIEGYYTEYDEDMSRRYRKMAADLGLLLSGGSDFHGDNKVNYNLGTGHGNLRIPYSLLESLKR